MWHLAYVGHYSVQCNTSDHTRLRPGRLTTSFTPSLCHTGRHVVFAVRLLRNKQPKARWERAASDCWCPQRPASLLLQEALMVILRPVEWPRRFERRVFQWAPKRTATGELALHCIRDAQLRLAMVEDSRSILCAEVCRRWLVVLPKESINCLEIDHLRVVCDTESLRVISNRLVGRVRCTAAAIADDCLDDARDALKLILGPPKSSHRKSGGSAVGAENRVWESRAAGQLVLHDDVAGASAHVRTADAIRRHRRRHKQGRKTHLRFAVPRSNNLSHPCSHTTVGIL